MKTRKSAYILVAAFALPLLASCALPTERLADDMRKGSLSYKMAKQYLDDGANVRDLWLGKSFLYEAAIRKRWDLVKLFADYGANPWRLEMESGEPFSLFDYALEERNIELIGLCFSHTDADPSFAEERVLRFLDTVDPVDLMNAPRFKSFDSCVFYCLKESPLAKTDAIAWKLAQIEEEERLAAIEAEKRRAEEERQRLEQERVEALKAMENSMEIEEKQRIRSRLQSEIFPAEDELSEEERSRGYALLTSFGEAQMPNLAERVASARRDYLEAKANLEELAKTLRDENIELKKNAVYQAAELRMLDLATEYWFLRYKLTDFYSQFKIGLFSSDGLAAEDEAFLKKQ